MSSRYFARFELPQGGFGEYFTSLGAATGAATDRMRSGQVVSAMVYKVTAEGKLLLLHTYGEEPKMERDGSRGSTLLRRRHLRGKPQAEQEI